MDDELVEMVVESVRVHMLSSRHVVILKETGRERYLPDLDRPVGGERDRDAAPGPDPGTPAHPRPVRHHARGARRAVARVVISDLAEETFHARLFLERDGHVGEVDARPSDALALAVRVGVPIFAVAVGPRPGRRSAPTAGSARRARRARCSRSTGEGIVDPRLDVFRDFVNSLEVDPDSENR